MSSGFARKTLDGLTAQGGTTADDIVAVEITATTALLVWEFSPEATQGYQIFRDCVYTATSTRKSA